MGKYFEELEYTTNLIPDAIGVHQRHKPSSIEFRGPLTGLDNLERFTF